MAEGLGKQAKQSALKDIIQGLHGGLSVEDAKERFEKEVGNVTSTEIAEMEQGLINEGLSPDEIKKFCNVHALLFRSALEKVAAGETYPSHPVSLFRQENREIEKRVQAVRDVAGKGTEAVTPTFIRELKGALRELKKVTTHYERKEQLLFPFLEKQGFMGPSKVMWGKDNEVRELLRQAEDRLEVVKDKEQFPAYARESLNPLLEEVEGMIFKEENILFPTSLEKLSSQDWVDILRDSPEIGYVFITPPAETEALIKELQSALQEEPCFEDGDITLPTGTLRLSELVPVLNVLPIDITFVDAEDTVRYFTEGKDRLFHRTRSIIGRNVQNCHPPQSLEVVEKILAAFKEGRKDSYEFWIDFKGKKAYIQFLAVRSRQGKYLGTIEVTQDITAIRKLTGEKRLVDERD
ncbi:MAG: DUF438 domain-containing protein [Chloroflexota bacterium]